MATPRDTVAWQRHATFEIAYRAICTALRTEPALPPWETTAAPLMQQMWRSGLDTHFTAKLFTERADLVPRLVELAVGAHTAMLVPELANTLAWSLVAVIVPLPVEVKAKLLAWLTMLEGPAARPLSYKAQIR